MSKNSISRRHFLGAAVASTVTAHGAAPRMESGLPTRVLGGTGERVSMLALGCGSRLLMYKDEDKGVELLDMAIKAGVTYLDTAQNYGNGTNCINESDPRIYEVSTNEVAVVFSTKEAYWFDEVSRVYTVQFGCKATLTYDEPSCEFTFVCGDVTYYFDACGDFKSSKQPGGDVR